MTKDYADLLKDSISYEDAIYWGLNMIIVKCPKEQKILMDLMRLKAKSDVILRLTEAYFRKELPLSEILDFLKIKIKSMQDNIDELKELIGD